MVPGAAQRAGIAALADQDHADAQRESYRRRLGRLRDILDAVGVAAPMPEGGIYCGRRPPVATPGGSPPAWQPRPGWWSRPASSTAPRAPATSGSLPSPRWNVSNWSPPGWERGPPVTDLLAAAAELVAIPSLSKQERELADHVESVLRQAPGLEVTRVSDNVVARTDLGLGSRLVVAGHLDTVPPTDNLSPRTVGDTLWGLGSTDMKGGLAVMLDLAGGLARPVCDVTFIFYAAEEIDRSHSGLLELASARPDLLAASAAIVCEPTNSSVEAGCQGVLKAEVVMGGRRAHVARPWMGSNAIHRLAPVVGAIADGSAREVRIDGWHVPRVPASGEDIRRCGVQRGARLCCGRAQLPLRA